MSVLAERVYNEINGIIVTALKLNSSVIVTKATKFVRFDWRTLMHYFETTGIGINPPWVIIRPGPSEEADYAMGTHHQTIPIEIFLIQSDRNSVVSEATSDGIFTFFPLPAHASFNVTNANNMFIGQRLLIADTNYSFITAITGTTISVSPIISVSQGDSITSDITSDVDVQCDIIKSAFLPKNIFQNFAILEDVKNDVSDMNPANDLEESNYNLLAGSVYIKILVGEILDGMM